MSFTPVTITGQWQEADGSPSSGVLYATPSTVLTNDGEEQSADPIRGVLDETGSLVTWSGDPFIINATEDADTLPAEAFYTFTLKLYGQDMVEFNAIVPATSPQTFNDLQENAV